MKRNRSRGFTLVEALVALLALSIGLLGVAALQMSGLRANVSSSWRSQATYLSYDILDRMRANRAQRAQYVIGLGATPARSNLPTNDLADWKANLANTLPSGDGSIVVNGDIVTVTVQWQDERDPSIAPLQFVTVSRI